MVEKRYFKYILGGLIAVVGTTGLFSNRMLQCNEIQNKEPITGGTLSQGVEVEEENVDDRQADKQEIKQESTFLKSAQEETLYGIGSVSKMYVTTAIMQLVDEGKIELDNPVTDYLPEFQMEDERYKEITVRMLLNHSSGLMGSTFSNNILYEDNDSTAHDTLLEKLKVQRLKADPGKYSTYCNDGFVVAELIVERVSGESFTEYLKEHIWKRLDFKQSGTSIDLFDAKNQVQTYFNPTILYATEYCNVFGTGGILSTAGEVCRFGQTFMRDNNGLLSEYALEEMKKPAAKTNDYGYVAEGSCDNYGLGWDSVDAYLFNEYGITTLVKGGDLLNQHGVLMVVPEENVSVSVLSSGGSSVFNTLLAEELATIVLEEKGIMAPSSDEFIKENIREEKEANKEAKVPNEYLSYEGSYANGQGIYHLSFPEGEYLQLEACDTETQKVQKYYYLGEGQFASEKGCYINGTDLTSATGNQHGETILTLKTEKDGKEYLCVKSTIEYEEVGSTRFDNMFAEKLQPQNIDQHTLEAWKARDGKKYYLTSEKYSSAFWNINPVIELKMSTEIEGYLNASGRMVTTRITDSNHSKAFVTLTGGAGRDLTDVTLQKVNGYEEISLDDVAIKYVEEVKMKPLDLSQKQIVLEERGALWYSIKEEDVKKEIYINPSSQMAVYVYNRYDECTYSSYMLNMGKRIILPEGGKVAVVGEAGAKLEIEEK